MEPVWGIGRAEGRDMESVKNTPYPEPVSRVDSEFGQGQYNKHYSGICGSGVIESS